VNIIKKQQIEYSTNYSCLVYASFVGKHCLCQLCWQTLLIIELGLVVPDLFDNVFMYVYMC
jgi:hypothetical protein